MKDADKEVSTPGKGRPYRGEDSESRVTRRRAALIEAGLELFGTKGYRTTSVKEICGEVGLTERYFYESFANRDALLAAVFDTLVKALDARLRDALQTSRNGPEERVRVVLAAFFHFVRDDERHARVLLLEILGVNADIDRRYQTAVRNLAQLMEHPSLGLFSADRPGSSRARRMTSIGLVGAITQIATQWMLEGFRTSYRDVERSALIIFRAVADAARR